MQMDFPKNVNIVILFLFAGGCQFAASEKNNGKYGFPFCEREYMEEQLKGFILNNIYQ